MNPLVKRLQNYLPVKSFYFDRPIVIFQSDDWGLLGVRDRAGFQELQAAGVQLGAHPYDFYSMETADDLDALYQLLRQHRDARGHHPSFVFNFVTANIDFEKTRANHFQTIELRALAQGLPSLWERPALFDAYTNGISQGLVYPAFHGLTHFCKPSAERALKTRDARGELLRALYASATPMLPSQMTWLRCEYYDRLEDADGSWLDFRAQHHAIETGVKFFTQLFGKPPLSACAPGYRANDDTRTVWAVHGIRVAQSKSQQLVAPYFDSSGLLMLYRNVELEPALDDADDVVERAIAQAERAFAANLPAIVCIHSINFHSTLKNFRARTVECLEQFLTAICARHPDLIFWNDAHVLTAIQKRGFADGMVRVQVSARWQESVQLQHSRTRWKQKQSASH